MHPWLNWIKHHPPKVGIARSNRAGCATNFCCCARCAFTNSWGKTMFRIIAILSLFLMTACNSVYVKPNSLDPNHKIFVPRGGYSMKRSVKQTMDMRGYNVFVGRLTETTESSDFDIEKYEIPSDAKYSVRVQERSEIFRPIWCMFNGFWWWNFNVSIVEQKTGTEILSWRGRGCQNSSLRKLNDLLDTMEIKK